MRFKYSNLHRGEPFLRLINETAVRTPTPAPCPTTVQVKSLNSTVITSTTRTRIQLQTFIRCESMSAIQTRTTPPDTVCGIPRINNLQPLGFTSSALHATHSPCTDPYLLHNRLLYIVADDRSTPSRSTTWQSMFVVLNQVAPSTYKFSISHQYPDQSSVAFSLDQNSNYISSKLPTEIPRRTRGVSNIWADSL